MRASSVAFGISFLITGFAWAQVPLGPELQVNPIHGTYEDVPSAGIADDGRAAVVWNEQAGLNKEVRFLDSSGHTQGESQRLNTVLDNGFPECQNMDLAGSGNGFACWTGSGTRIHCRAISSEGAVGADEIEVSSRPYVFGQREGAEDVAVREDGSAVVVWLYELEDVEAGTSAYSIEGRYLDSTGAPIGEVFEVATTSQPDTATAVSVAVIGPDRSLVTWNAPNADGNGDGVRGQLVDATGASVGAAFVINTYVAGHQQLANVDADLQGRSVVVWESIGQDGSQTGIYGQRFDRNGARMGRLAASR